MASSIMEYIEDGDLAAVQQTIAENPELINARISSSGGTPLMYTLYSSSEFHADIAQWLIRAGADLDIQDRNGDTALMLTSTLGEPEIARLIVSKGADLDLQNEFGSTALIEASRNKQAEIAQFLITKGAELNFQDRDGKSVIMYAAELGQSETVDMLIAAGASMDLQSNEGWTALMFACRYDHFETAALLIQKGADINIQELGGWNALLITCRFEQPETAQILIQKGVDVDVLGPDGWTALMFATRFNQPETAILLIESGARLDMQNFGGWTALMLASRHNQLDIVEALIKKGARLDTQTKSGWTALMMACQPVDPVRHTGGDLIKIVKACWVGGADLNAKTDDGNDAMEIAALSDREDIVSFIEFVQTSEVALVLLEDIEAPREMVVAFFDNDYLTMEDCARLTEDDLQSIGIKMTLRKRALRRFQGMPIPPRSSVTRMSQHMSDRVTQMFQRGSKTDLSHARGW
eukprot:CAMPEP_0171569514 /NCGR_PEP_ID=MMETSP0961-20121227/2387_1 /TAXON_ID=87120 /ORGANISM="Aurantiochytrium limacinum, Strain ATCCMYA-1381" /LENGTH=466 /DNA_ID=CAMNT_0012123813 /DNA_START=510 /DNA_END=1907 /DNA_ORIENTATION=-